MIYGRPVVDAEPAGVLACLDELLRRPQAPSERAASGGSVMPWVARIVAGTAACASLYGAASGFFQGGSQVLYAGLKAPVILLASAALCLPSLYVFALLAGAALTASRFVVVLLSYLGLLALVLVGLLPIEWLFSVSSQSLTFVVWLHLVLWVLALGFGWRFLRAALPEVPFGALVLWVGLFCVVSFQVATFVRPVLLRNEGVPLVEPGKLFFLDHFNNVVD
ncbi:MAG: hypothetical protein U0Q12_14395 [Vicinamibacterales bacterium]